MKKNRKFPVSCYYFITVFLFCIMVVNTGCTSKEELSYGNTETQESAEEDIAMSDDQNIEEKKIHIGVTLASSDASYQILLSEYIQKEAEKKQIELTLCYAEWDSQEQEGQIDTFLEDNMDAIILCPVNAKSMLGALKKAQNAGIPVINLNMKVDDISTEYIDTYVGASTVEEATLAAEMVKGILGDIGGKVAIIEGKPGTDPQIYRTKGFFDEIAAFPQIQVVQIGEGDWERDKAYRKALTMINKSPDLSVVYAQDSEMAMGAVRAVEEQGLSDQIQVIGIGEGEEYSNAVKEGRLYGFVYQDAEFEGTKAIDCAIEAASGSVLHPWYKNPVQIITKENIEDIEN